MQKPRAITLRRPLSRLLAILTVSAMISFSAFAQETNMSVGDKKYQDTQKSLKQLRNQISDITKNLNQSRNERQELNAALRAAELEMGKLAKQKQTTEKAINELTARLEKLETEQTQLIKDEQQQKQLISKQLIHNWQLNRQPDIKILLNQQSPDTLARIMMYSKYINDARFAVLEKHKETLANLDAIRQNIAKESENLKKAQEEQALNHQALEQENQSRQVTLSALDATIATQDERLKTLIRDRNALEKLLKSVEEAITQLKPETTANQLSFTARKGQMRWPAKGKIRQKFGGQRENGKLNWDGVVINAASGSSVNTIHQGRIVFSDWFRGMGLLVIVDHGDGYLSLYAHNQSLLRDTGDWVQSGDAIATVGNSGGQSNNGLYFEIRHKGQPVNPALWCK